MPSRASLLTVPVLAAVLAGCGGTHTAAPKLVAARPPTAVPTPTADPSLENVAAQVLAGRRLIGEGQSLLKAATDAENQALTDTATMDFSDATRHISLGRSLLPADAFGAYGQVTAILSRAAGHYLLATSLAAHHPGSARNEARAGDADLTQADHLLQAQPEVHIASVLNDAFSRVTKAERAQAASVARTTVKHRKPVHHAAPKPHATTAPAPAVVATTAPTVRPTSTATATPVPPTATPVPPTATPVPPTTTPRPAVRVVHPRPSAPDSPSAVATAQAIAVTAAQSSIPRVAFTGATAVAVHAMQAASAHLADQLALARSAASNPVAASGVQAQSSLVKLTLHRVALPANAPRSLRRALWAYRMAATALARGDSKSVAAATNYLRIGDAALKTAGA